MNRINLGALRCLIADDNANMRRIVHTCLHAFGIREVYDAADGADALEAFNRHQPDIIILDWVMPVFSGIDVVRMIRQPIGNANPFVPIIMLTAHPERSSVIAAREAGITEFLAKPISATALYQRIANAATNPRPFIKIKSYFGPDRRRGVNDKYIGPKRRGNAAQNAIRVPSLYNKIANRGFAPPNEAETAPSQDRVIVNDTDRTAAPFWQAGGEARLQGEQPKAAGPAKIPKNAA